MSKRLTRIQSLLAKVEATEGTDATPTASNAIRVAGAVGITEGEEVQNMREDAISESIDRLNPLAPAGKYVELTIPWHVRGYGSAYSASNLPEADPLFQACGLSQTVVTTGGSESVTYDFLSTSQKSCSIYLYADGILNKVLGCRGTLKIDSPAGQPMTITFTMRGLRQTVTDTALVAGTYQTTVPPALKGASSIAYNAVATLIARSYAADLGATISPRLSINATDALAGYHITGRATTASFVVEGPLVATADFRGDRDAATARTLDLVLGATQYNKMSVKIDKFTPVQVAVTDGDGFALNEVTGRVTIEGTEDFSLLFN